MKYFTHLNLLINSDFILFLFRSTIPEPSTLNIKKYFGDQALSVFIQPPSIEVLRQRLEGRGTDTPEVIENRIARAQYELSFANKFDVVIVNDILEEAENKALITVKQFIEQ